jgi:gas vesicle protein
MHRESRPKLNADGLQKRRIDMARTNWQGTATGVVIGLGIGVGLGMLFAPKSGQEAREELIGTVKNGLDTAVAAGQDLGRRTQRNVEYAKSRVRDAAEAVGHAYQDAKTNA